MLEFLLQLILSHLIGDFLLQPQKWVTEKNIHGVKSKYLYYHIGVHVLLLTPFLFADFHYYVVALLILIPSHYAVDLIKITISKKYPNKNTLWFFCDQAAHLFIIAIVADLYYPNYINYEILTSTYWLIIGIAIIMIFFVSPVVVRQLVSKWANIINAGNGTDSLTDAGKYIGIMERLLIVLFICVGFHEGIGYLLAAKSIFRFGDLKKSKEKKLTEYILLGTLISFAFAIIIGLALKYAITTINK